MPGYSLIIISDVLLVLKFDPIFGFGGILKSIVWFV